MYAMMCGYAVDGRDFYYIPHSAAIRPRAEAKMAIVRVVEGEMTIMQVKSEMERLVPARMAWLLRKLRRIYLRPSFR
jgi:hypothetical protein